ncbi:MAG: ammonium transporter [Chitinivibrionales bacterium]|nr:ammonium transporter [Chitinivibrionales bacterium]MBD3397006.1 ammonium transporter [Chitinivibrionales bacterium]
MKPANRVAGVLITCGILSPLYADDGTAINLVDTLWVLTAAFLVFFMNAGFAFVETGFCRAKNAVNILGKNFSVFAIAAIAFWAVGYGLMFGTGAGLVGTDSFLVDETANNPASNIPVFAFFFFQAAFAAAGCSIISGAVAERIKFISYLIFGFVLVAVIYPLGGHWVWGGGWLSRMGFHDFAGSTVVHSVGGWAALAGVLLLGPRLGKYMPDGTSKAIVGHSIPLATLGGFILWLGWFGFNPGSQLALDGNVPRIALTTALASCAGILGAMITAWVVGGKPDLSMIINGCLAGLVAITAPCAVVSTLGSLFIGGIAGILVVLAVYGFERLHIDDPVGALGVHLVNGIWGTLAVGLFAAPRYMDGTAGLFYGGGLKLLGVQFVGVLAVGAAAFGLSLGLWAVLKSTLGIRVSREEEIGGLDVGEMGMEAYNGFQIFTTS